MRIAFSILFATVLSVVAGTFYQGDGWFFNDGAFMFTDNYIWTQFVIRTDKRPATEVGELVELGYYLLDSGKASDPVPMFSSRQEIHNSVIFQGGATIGIYAKIESALAGHWEYQETGRYDKKGRWVADHEWVYVQGEKSITTWTTTPDAIEGARANTNNVDHDSLHSGSGPQFFCLFLSDPIGPVSHYEYYLAGMVAGDDYNQFISDVIDQNTGADGKPSTVVVDGSTGKPVTTGQPLPGVFASVALGGAAIAAFRRRRA